LGFGNTNLSVPRNSSSRKATADIRQLFQSATSLEIVEAGSAIPLRAKSFHGDSLQRLAKAATIYDLDKTNIPSTVVADAYVHFQLMKDGTVLQEYWFRYLDYLVDDSPGHNREGSGSLSGSHGPEMRFRLRTLLIVYV
jgi:hypothetical protein